VLLLYYSSIYKREPFYVKYFDLLRDAMLVRLARADIGLSSTVRFAVTNMDFSVQVRLKNKQTSHIFVTGTQQSP